MLLLLSHSDTPLLRIVQIMAEQTLGGEMIKVKNPEDVKVKRDLVLAKYQGFKDAAKQRRVRLEGAKKFHQFKRDADELEAWVSEKLQLVSEESLKDRANLQVSSKSIGC